MRKWFSSLRRKFTKSDEFKEIQRQVASSEGLRELSGDPEKLKHFHDTIKYVRTDGTPIEPSPKLTEAERLQLLLSDPDEVE